jgi:hypothetical protein
VVQKAFEKFGVLRGLFLATGYMMAGAIFGSKLFIFK